MQKLSSLLSKNKKGAASLYVVIFTTILFGVITLSFIRIILSESRQSSNDDLSQSAYDAALAGVEDAKIAVNQYYKCLSSNPNDSSCNQYRGKTPFGGDCSHSNLLDYLGRDTGSDSEVKIQESSSNNSDQAYTCVLLSDETADYRATLTSDTRTKVVPLGVRRGSDGNYVSSNLNEAKSIKFSWYSDLNGTKMKNINTHNGLFSDKNGATVPPVVSLTLIKAHGQINIRDLNTDDNGSDYSTMILLPTDPSKEDSTDTITNDQIAAAGNASSKNSPFQIKCQSGGDFACEVTLSGLSFNADDSAFLVISLPYGDEYTDFKVALKNSNGEDMPFKGVQVSVDSTGRTNQLIRRVETRLDPADLFFPYPQYELDFNGNPNEEAIRKKFWITNNCWTDQGTCNNNGQL